MDWGAAENRRCEQGQALPATEEAMEKQLQIVRTDPFALTFEFLASDALAERERLANETADSVICLRVRREHQRFNLGDFQ